MSADLERELVAAFRGRRPPAFQIAATKDWITAIDAQMQKGRNDLARFAVRHLKKVEPDLEWARNIHRLLQKTEFENRERSDFRDDLSKDVQIVPHAGSDTVILCFCGIGAGLMMPLAMFQTWLQPLSASVVYLRDLQQSAYLGGIASLGDRAATIASLRRIASDLGARRIVCLGNSIGGFAAMQHAIELSADAALSLAGPTNLEPAFNTHLGHAAFANRILERFPGAPLDFRETYLAAQNRPRITIVYGENAWDDRLQAEHMAGVPGVELYPVAGCDRHNVIAPLIDEGAFAPLLARVIGGA